MLTIVEEFDAAVRALKVKDGATIPLFVIALGLAGEAGEVAECERCLADLQDELAEEEDLADFRQSLAYELGDVLWYATAALQSLGTSLAEETDKRGSNKLRSLPLEERVGLFCDLIKKNIWHDKAYEISYLRDVVYDIVSQCGVLAWENGYTLSQVLRLNIRKLQARWPHGFGVAK